MMHACAVSTTRRFRIFQLPLFKKRRLPDDDVIHIYLLALHMLSTVFMWTGENYSNTLRVDAYFLMVTALENGLLMRRTENFLC